MLVGESMLALPRQYMRCDLSDITQSDGRKLVGLSERSWECMFFAHLLRIEEGILSVEAGPGRIGQHKKVCNIAESRQEQNIPDHNRRMSSRGTRIALRLENELLQINEFTKTRLLLRIRKVTSS